MIGCYINCFTISIPGLYAADWPTELISVKCPHCTQPAFAIKFGQKSELTDKAKYWPTTNKHILWHISTHHIKTSVTLGEQPPGFHSTCHWQQSQLHKLTISTFCGIAHHSFASPVLSGLPQSHIFCSPSWKTPSNIKILTEYIIFNIKYLMFIFLHTATYYYSYCHIHPVIFLKNYKEYHLPMYTSTVMACNPGLSFLFLTKYLASSVGFTRRFRFCSILTLEHIWKSIITRENMYNM